MRFNINAILKSLTKNPTQIILVGVAFGAGYLVAQKLLVQQASANAAIPQYQNESEVVYPRHFQGKEGWEYTDPVGHTVPEVSNMDGNSMAPEVMNAYYDDVVDDSYFYSNDGYNSGELVDDTTVLDYY